MRFIYLGLFAFAFVACGPARFSGESGAANKTAAAPVSPDVVDLCTAAGLVPKVDSDSDDDSTSLDDDSVDGVSADGVSSDDDSSDDKACATSADCIKKKCEPAPVQ